MRIPIVPLLATSLGADAVQVGMVNGSFMIMAGVFSIPAGRLSDRFGRRVPLLGGLFILAGSSFLLFWSSSLMQMAIIYLLFGLGLSTFTPALMSYVADVTPPEDLGRSYGWYTMAVYGGMTVGPAAGGFIGSSLGLHTVFPIAGGLIIAMFFVVMFFLPAQSTIHRTDKQSHAIVPTLKKFIKNQQLIACLVATAGCCIGFGMYITFLPVYMSNQGMSTMHVGFVFATQALANALARFPSGALCDRIADRSSIVSGGLAFFAMALAAYGLCHTVASFMATAVAMGISMGAAFTVICTLIADAVPKEKRGLAMGCYNTSIYIGMLLGSIGMAPIIRGEGFRIGFFLNGAVGVVVLVLFRYLYRRPLISV